jgi:hypothetical protein
MTWAEVRVDSKGRKSVIKHKGEKPANIPYVSDKPKHQKAHVLPRGGEPYIANRGERPSGLRGGGLDVPYGHGRGARPVSRDSNTTIAISIHPDDSVSSRGRDDHERERPTTPHGYDRDGHRRGYNRPASRPTSRNGPAAGGPWGGNTELVFPTSRAPVPSRHGPTVSTADFVHGDGPVRARDPSRPLSRASASGYEPVSGSRVSHRVSYNVVEVEPKRHAAARSEHSATLRALEGRQPTSRTGRARSPQRGPSEAGEVYDRHLRRSYAPSQHSASHYSQEQ